jgi:hypothetical protein
MAPRANNSGVPAPSPNELALLGCEAYLSAGVALSPLTQYIRSLGRNASTVNGLSRTGL